MTGLSLWASVLGICAQGMGMMDLLLDHQGQWCSDWSRSGLRLHQGPSSSISYLRASASPFVKWEEWIWYTSQGHCEDSMRWPHMSTNIYWGPTMSPCLFNLYAEYIMQNARLDEAQAGIKIAGRNINYLRYIDDTTTHGRKWRTKEPLDESERGEWKSWFKIQHSEN